MLIYIISQLLYVVSKCTNAVLKLFFRRSLFSGPLADHTASQLDLQRSAHTLRVVYRCTPTSVASPSRKNFLLVHKNYSDPTVSILEDNRVSLMNVSSTHGIFAVTPSGFDVHDETHGPFFYHVQYQCCNEIIEIPLSFMVPLANQLPKRSNTASSQPVVVLYNTGRCGSTLLSKMLTALPNVVGISEPDALLLRVNDGSNVRGDYAKLLGAIVDLQCKDFHFNQTVVLKPRSQATEFVTELAAGSPDTKLLFMYRDPIPTISSFVLISEALPRIVLKGFLPTLTQSALDMSHYRGEQLALLKSRLEVAAANWDMVEFNTLSLLALIAGYQFAKNKGVRMHVVKYEDLLKDPKGQVKAILEFCGVHNITENDLDNSLKAMESDSQAGSVIGQDNRKSNKTHPERNEFALLYKGKINYTLSLFGFPTVDKFHSIFAP